MQPQNLGQNISSNANQMYNMAADAGDWIRKTLSNSRNIFSKSDPAYGPSGTPPQTSSPTPSPIGLNFSGLNYSVPPTPPSTTIDASNVSSGTYNVAPKTPAGQASYQSGALLPPPGTPEYAQAQALAAGANGGPSHADTALTTAVDTYHNQYTPGYSNIGAGNVPSTDANGNPVPGGTNSNGNAPGQNDVENYLMGLIGQEGQRGAEFNNLYNTYGVPQLQQNLANINSQIMATTKSYNDQIAQLTGNLPGGPGNINGTLMQANPQIQNLQRMKNNDLANLAIAQAGMSNNLEAANNIINAKLAAEFDPIDKQIQGLQNYMDIYRNDMSTSQAKQADAAIAAITDERNALITAKQDAYKTAVQYGAGPDVMNAIGSAQTVQDAYGAVGGLLSGNSTSGGTGSINQNLPGPLQTYLSASGGEYINASKVAPDQQAAVTRMAAQNGIPYLQPGDVAAVQSIDYTKENIASLNNVVNQILGSGPAGRIGSSIANFVGSNLQTDPRVVAFNAARDTAIKSIQSLVAGTGTGFRLTQPEINQAVSNMPTIYDSKEFAQQKIDWLNTFLDVKRNLIMHGTATPPPPTQTQGGIVNTSAGAVNTNW